MMRSLYSAVSGLKTHQTRMDVIGNNIANVNTEAFKSSSVTFSEIMYQTLSSASSGNGATGTGGMNAKQIGLGVSTGSTTVSIESAGAAETTGNPFDLKLTDSQTTNFFIVSDGTNTMFTRAGSFYVDGNGFLCMSSTGYTLMGWQVDPTTGEIRKDTVSALQVMSPGNQTSQPEATQQAYVSGVLDKNDPNLANEEGYVLALSFYDSLGYGYTGKFKVTPALDENGEIKNAGEYNIELTDIIDQVGKSILKDPTDPTGETYLPGMDPGRLFSTGEVAPVDVTTAQSAYDASGNKYAIYNLGTAASPALYTLDNFGNLYRVEENGSSYATELDEEHLAYKLVKDQDGKIFYATPDQIQNVSATTENIVKVNGKSVSANGIPAFTYTVGAYDDANKNTKKLYKIVDDKLYEVSKNPITGEYASTAEPSASKYTGAGGAEIYLTETPKTLTLGDAEYTDRTYEYYHVNGKYYALDPATGKLYSATKTNAVAASDYSPVDAVEVTPANPLTDDMLVYTDASGAKYYQDGTNKYVVNADGKTYAAKWTDAIPATYTADTANLAYVSVTGEGGAAFFAEPKTVIYGNTQENSDVKTDGVSVYEIDGEWYTKDDKDNLYKIKDKTNLTNLESEDTATYVAYKDGQGVQAYILANEVLVPDTDPTFSDIKNKPFTITKTVQKYTPYTIVYDQNKGTFVSCGVDNQAEGSSLMLNLADVMINHVVTDPDGADNIFVSEDGFTTSNFSNIEIDFTKSMNYNNNLTSTMKALKGDRTGDGTGKKLGALTGLTVDTDGKIYGTYDNGNTVLLCQIACAQFSNASGLEKVGENCYMTTLNSGEFDGIGVEVDADGSAISTGELEMSNVDLSAEFTSMIITQRGFQANSRVITTSDTLLEELINLKR